MDILSEELIRYLKCFVSYPLLVHLLLIKNLNEYALIMLIPYFWPKWVKIMDSNRLRYMWDYQFI